MCDYDTCVVIFQHIIFNNQEETKAKGHPQRGKKTLYMNDRLRGVKNNFFFVPVFLFVPYFPLCSQLI
jgi:hypothetical protein